MEIGVLLQVLGIAVTAAGLVGAVVGFFLKGINSSIKEVKDEVEKNGREIAVVREMVSGHDKRIDKLEEQVRYVLGQVIEVKTRVDNCPNCNL